MDERRLCKRKKGMTPICLIIPPSPFLLDERVFMSLGILKVAAVLERSSIPVEVLDLSGIENFAEVIRVHATTSRSRVFGITATTPQMPSAFAIRNVIKEVLPDSKVILGGPHPTLVLAGSKKTTSGRILRAKNELEASFDVIVAGDGEEAIFEAIREDSHGWIDADDSKSPLFLDNKRLDDLPFPSRHLVDTSSYHYTIDGERALSMIAQLGCPFGCGFCGGRASPMLRRVRMRSTGNIVAEMIHLYQNYGVKGFMLYDDELNVNPKLVELMNRIAKIQQDLQVDFRLRGFVKAELFNDYQAAAMYKAGFRWILVGFESGSDRILTNINKRSTKEENTRCMNIARRHGLKVKALMSVGHPGESTATIQETKRWLLETSPDDFDVTIITPYPGSPYYDESVPHFNGDWVYLYKDTGDRLFSKELDYFKTADYYKGDPNGGYRSYVYTDHLTTVELVTERDRLEKDVREVLGIPFNSSVQSTRFEHSMGQTSLPETILRSTQKTQGGILSC
jgi:anaerobic magnesium-protoporphyrin IX monomethyl ester cyclase